MNNSKLFCSIILLLIQLNYSFADDSIPSNSLKNNENLTHEGASTPVTSDSLYNSIFLRLLRELKNAESTIASTKAVATTESKNADSVRRSILMKEIAKLNPNAIGYPVIPQKDTLFLIYVGSGNLTAAERASLLSERIEKLYHELFLNADSFYIENSGYNINLLFKDKIILSVTEYDAFLTGKSQLELAAEYKDIIVKDIIESRKNRSLWSVLIKVSLTLLVIFVQVILIRAINYLFRGKINKFLWNKRGVWFKGVKIRNYEVVNQNRETEAILFLAKVSRFTLIILLLYLTLPILFSIFPLTRRLAEMLFGYILNPLRKIGSAVVNYIPELITILVIVVITRYILKFLRFLASEVEEGKLKLPGFFPDWAKPTYNIIKIFILAFMFVVIFPYLPGSDSPVFKGVSVFLGIVFSLGSSSVIGNMVAGLVITYMRPFKIGDRIKIGEIVGDVIEKTPFVTRLQTPKKEYITIPNSNILSNNVVNYSTSQNIGGIVLHTTVTIGYDVPWRTVHKLLLNAAKKTKLTQSDPEPFVLQTSLDDFYVSYQLNVHTNDPDKQPAIYSELHQNIQDSFNEEGIEILSPHYRAARDGNTLGIPPEYHPKNYKPGGFRMES